MLWIIALVLLGLIYVFIQVNSFKQSWTVFIFIVLLVLVFFSMSGMIRSGELDFSTAGNSINSLGVYAGWLGKTTINVFSVVKDSFRTVGHVISSNTTEIKEK